MLPKMLHRKSTSNAILISSSSAAAGPWPNLALTLRLIGLALSPIDMEWAYHNSRLNILFGPFCDPWIFVVVHLWVWLAVLCMIRYFRITKPVLFLNALTSPATAIRHLRI